MTRPGATASYERATQEATSAPAVIRGASSSPVPAARPVAPASGAHRRPQVLRARRRGGLVALVMVGVMGALGASGCVPNTPSAGTGASIVQQPSPGAPTVAAFPTPRVTVATGTSTPAVSPTPPVLATPPAIPSPTAQASPSAPPIPANWRTYASADLGFALRYPPGLEVSPNGANSVMIGAPGDETGPSSPSSRTFVYVSVIPRGFQSQGGEIVNYNTPEAEALFALRVGESRSLRPGGDPAVVRAFTYTRLPDAPLGGASARVYVNPSPWEAPPGITEYRYYAEQRTATYLVGGYVAGEGIRGDRAISVDLFRQLLGTVRVTGLPDFTAPPEAAPGPVGCADAAAFVGDVTVPDGTRIVQGASFVKTWRLRNRGTCPWSAGYALVFASGEPLAAPPAVPLGQVVALGQTADLSVTLTAPAAAGTYRASWRLRSARGLVFGIDTSADGTFWVEITVIAPPGVLGPAGASGRATPTLDPAHSGQGVIEFVGIERGSGARLVTVGGVGTFGIAADTRIIDEHGMPVDFGALRPGQLVFVSGEPGEGLLLAHEIRLLRV